MQFKRSISSLTKRPVAKFKLLDQWWIIDYEMIGSLQCKIWRIWSDNSYSNKDINYFYPCEKGGHIIKIIVGTVPPIGPIDEHPTEQIMEVVNPGSFYSYE